MIDPAVPLSLCGHSFGARTVSAALQGLAAGEIAGHALPARQHVGSRPLQATLWAGALDNTVWQPGNRHSQALTQVEQVVVTVNPNDVPLQAFSMISGRDMIGAYGLANPAALGEMRSRVYTLPSDQVGVMHRLKSYERRPEIIDGLRPFFFYYHSADALNPLSVESN